MILGKSFLISVIISRPVSSPVTREEFPLRVWWGLRENPHTGFGIHSTCPTERAQRPVRTVSTMMPTSPAVAVTTEAAVAAVGRLNRRASSSCHPARLPAAASQILWLARSIQQLDLLQSYDKRDHPILNACSIFLSVFCGLLVLRKQEISHFLNLKMC